VTQEEIEAEIGEIRRITRVAKPFFGTDVEPDTETRFQIYKNFAVTDAQIEELIADAGKGDAFSESVLSHVACARFLDARPLDKWILSVLREATKRKRRKGRRRSCQGRDSFVSYAVSQVLKRHPELHPSKGRFSKTKVTACGIVSGALAREGINLGESRVAGIFEKQQNVVALHRVLDL
jgi:hypothetical protein